MEASISRRRWRGPATSQLPRWPQESGISTRTLGSPLGSCSWSDWESWARTSARGAHALIPKRTSAAGSTRKAFLHLRAGRGSQGEHQRQSAGHHASGQVRLIRRIARSPSPDRCHARRLPTDFKLASGGFPGYDDAAPGRRRLTEDIEELRRDLLMFLNIALRRGGQTASP